MDISKKLPIGTPYVQCEMHLHDGFIGEFLLLIELDGKANSYPVLTKDANKFKDLIKLRQVALS